MTDVATIAAPPPASVGSLIDEYFDLRNELRDVQSQEKDIKASMTQIEEQLLALYDEQGITLCRGRRASASITTGEVPVVRDWDAFYEYVLENSALHLLERRPSTAAWRELREGGEEVPGTEPFTKRGISVRTL
jgi:hypothetical protein